ncbi:unnamed protein product, partial [Prorocentrum cordatum]
EATAFQELGASRPAAGLRASARRGAQPHAAASAAAVSAEARHFWDAPHGPRAAPLSRSARAPRRAVQRRQRRAREHAGRLCAAQQEGPPPQGGGRHARGQQHPEGLPQEHQAMLGPRCFVPK